ncbi:hypothetical protein [Paenibacillus woosongensis]|uniref:Uncharacterized protein n=1 Tax=Paenibacillus woosongensis TaxID=307580 RepID=A0A7X3CNK2_9BACL|nr:hypothetical protein [Paenibacillus woosongensis]MUG45252.1 hypothetical protein [Paenibacillus woosongensis]
MRIRAFCDFYNEAYRPLQLVIKCEPGELDWSQTLYISLPSPLEPLEAEDYGDERGVSVLMDDLVSQADDDSLLGILLPQIYGRHGETFELLLVQMDDVEEILQLDRYY